MNTIDTLNAAVMSGLNGYLRTCSTGGMPKKLEDNIRKHVQVACDLHYIATSIARTAAPQLADRADKEASEFFRKLAGEIKGE